MSSLVLAKLDYKNEFRLSLNCDYDDASINIDAKIDTGAVRTLLPLKTIRYIHSSDKDRLKDFTRDSYYKMLKNEYINSNIKYSVIHGIEGIKYPSTLPIIDRPDIFFSKKITKIKFGDYTVSDSEFVSVSCDTDGNVLIGMDILSKFDFHCGFSRQLNSNIFVGVLRDQEDKSDYYRALKYHFGIISDCKDLLYYQFKESEVSKDEASGFFNWLSTRFGGINR